MNIDKYINWNEIWNEEVCLETSIDCLEDDNHHKVIEVIKQFQDDHDLELLPNECYIKNDKLFFFFGETGGQNESDTQGWSRDYCFVVDDEFLIMDASYQQG